MDINHVVLVGRLTRDIELKYTSGGLAIGSLALAVNRRRKNGEQWVEEVSFFDVSLFGKTAEGLKPYLLKGKQIAVEGELRQDRWEQDGQHRSKVVISADNVQLLGGEKPQAQKEATPRGAYTAPQESYQASSFPEDTPF